MLILKYTLSQNAISSLHIAIQHFKSFYYTKYSNKLSQSEVDEEIKISLVFLENSIELLLKAILVSIDETCIYKCPESKRIKRAQSCVNNENTLADVLLQDGNFQTIDYHEIVDKYIELTGETSEKFEKVLKQLSNARNSITHFGLEIASYDEIILLFFNTFDIIYNYLYERLCALDNIDNYFTSDDLIVNTIHGSKFLFSEDFVYNNIYDFLDELLMDNNEYVFELRASNTRTKISQFSNLFAETVKDRKFENLLERYDAKTDLNELNILKHQYSFSLEISKEMSFDILTRYSPFYNATIFMDDCGQIIFIVLHDENIFYLYNSDIVYPPMDEREKDAQWIEDEKNNLCMKYNLSKRNLIKAFESYVVKLIN